MPTMKGFRLSQQQKHLWTLQPESPAYRVQCAVLLEGLLQTQRLTTAIAQVVARHEILRTTFYRPPGIKVPFQVIAAPGMPSWQHVDLRAVSPAHQDAAVAELFREEGHRPFDFEHGPLVRLLLLALAADRHLLLVSLPAVCADTWTLKNLVYEMGYLYQKGSQNAAALDEPVQYADFAAWQDTVLTAEDGDAATGRAYWSKQSVAALPALRLPCERRRAGATTHTPASLTVQLGPEVVARVAAAARQHETSPAVFLLACWQTLLWRLTGAADILVGNVCDGRKDPDLHSAMGPLAECLPIICHFAATSPFSDIVWQVHEATRQGYEWQEYSPWSERFESATTADAPCGFAYMEWPAQHTAGLSVSLYRQYSFLHHFQLQVACTQTSGTLMTTWHYDPACLADETVCRVAGYFATLVQSAAHRPEAPVSALELLRAEDRQHLLVALNTTATAYPQAQCLQALFEAQVERTPHATAVVCGAQRLTYAELNTRANQLGHYLRQRGVAADVPVGLCMTHAVELLIGLLGILKAGGAYVPLHPEHPRARLAQQLAEIEAPVVLTQAALVERLAGLAGALLCLDRDAGLWAQASPTNPAANTTPEHPVYVLYTSGSTGVPKGVVVRHRSVVNYTHFICQYLGLQDTGGLQFALVSPLTADVGNTCLFPALVSGGCVHLVPYEVATDGASFRGYMARHGIDVLKIVPSHLQALLAAQPEGTAILPRKYLILGGEALSYSLVREIAARAGTCAVINHYGPTEATIGALTWRVDLRGETEWRSATVPIGRPIANAEVYILDDWMQPVPLGVPGELYLGGEGLAHGYLRQPDRTAERFVAHPFSHQPGARLYKTGDVGRYLPDGSIEFLGRTDHQVKLRGYRVELGEIEAVLERCPAVRQAIVLAREDEPGHTRLAAYVVPRGQPAPSVSTLQRFLQEELPAYMLPSAFVLLDTLPLLPNGKVDRQALPAPGEGSADDGKPYTAPRTPTEALLADIWAQVLGRERVGRHENFFAELGGDSILSIQIVARANQAGLRLLPKQMFEYQTIAELATVAGSALTMEAEQDLVTGQAPLLPIQHWFFEQQFADPQHWNQSVLLEVRQPLSPRLLEQVLHYLLAHHDALRLRFAHGASGWQQVNAGLDMATPFICIDLSGLPESEQRPALEAATAALQASLHLAAGPLLRVAYFEFGEWFASRLLLVFHHLVIDGVSWRIVLEDLQTGYEQLGRGEAVRLPPKTTSFKCWAEKLMEYARSGVLHTELDYWLGESRPRPHRLPVDYADGTNTVQSSHTVQVWLTPEETHALLHEVPEAYNTQINDVLLTALALALAGWTGGRAVLIEMEGHGREQLVEGVDPWRTVGWFTTHFPVLLDLGRATHPGDALMAIKEQLRAIPHRGIGYGLLRYLSGDAAVAERLRALPQPEVCFNYLGQFDQTLSASSPFAVARESGGPSQSLRGNRSYRLYVSGGIIAGRLQLTCLYSENIYRRATIEALTWSIAAALRTLMAHCQSSEVGNYTPSDFALAALDAHKLRTISGLIEAIDAAEEEAL